MPDRWDITWQRCLSLRVDDAHVGGGLDSNFASPRRHDVTPPGRCGKIVNFSVFTFGLSLFSKSVDLNLRLRQLNHRSDLRSANQQSLVLSADLPWEAVAVGVDGCGEELLDGSR